MMESSISVLEGDEEHFMVEDDRTDQIYEGRKVDDSEYVFGLFGCIHDEEITQINSSVERLDTSRDDVQSIAQDLSSKYSGPTEDPLKNTDNYSRTGVEVYENDLEIDSTSFDGLETVGDD